jgi:hypothetical protein
LTQLGGTVLNPQPVSREKAKELITQAEEQLNSLKVQGINLDSTNNLLTRTKKAFDAKRLNETINNLNELGSKLIEIKKYSKEFSTIVLACHKNIKQAVNIEIEVQEYKKILDSANDLFDEEHFKKAISTVRDCNQRLIDTQFLYITDMLKELYGQLKELPNNIMSYHGIQQRFNDADAAIQNNDFSLAWTLIKQLKQISDKILMPYIDKVQNIAKDKIIQFQDEIESAKGKGVDLSDAKEIFNEMIERVKSANNLSEFKEIVEYTTAGRHALERALRRKERVATKIKDVQNKFEPVFCDYEDLKAHCAIPSSVETLIKSAETKLDNQDFEGATEDIDKCNAKLNKLRSASSPKIELKIQTEDLKADLWNRTKLEVSNKGLASAADINIRFSGPLEVRRIPEIRDLVYNSSEVLEFGLKPEGAGSLPIDVDMDFKRSLDGKEYNEHQELWLDISPNITHQHSTVSTNSHPTKPIQQESFKIKSIVRDFVKCTYCERPLKSAEPIFKCSCGAIYHLTCITDLDICVKCGSDLSQKARTN